MNLSKKLKMIANSNPEGINQYTKGGGSGGKVPRSGLMATRAEGLSDTAKEASRQAKKIESIDEGPMAIKAHKVAADAHAKAANNWNGVDDKKSQYHTDKMSEHMAAAEDLKTLREDARYAPRDVRVGR